MAYRNSALSYFIGAVFAIGLAIYAISTGELPGKRGDHVLLLSESPRAFWFWVLVFAAAGVWCFWKMLKRLGSSE